MSWGFRWKPYVSVAQRKAKAARHAAQLAKAGKNLVPVTLLGRKIAGTFWGKAWCDNLEAYSDYANRLPRGRTYVRNGSVIDLQVASGEVTAMVYGSELYKIRIQIKPLAKARWTGLLSECAGKIDSLIELLQGRLSASVMEIVTRHENGLFPTPKEISLSCSCPDWAGMCKHVAASLYGVGARLDQKPELLFLLRGVDPVELIGSASAAEAVRQTAPVDGAARMDEADLADVFGIEIESKTLTPVPRLEEPAPPAYRAPRAKPTPKTKAKPTRRVATPKRYTLSAAARKRIAELQRKRWAALREKQTKTRRTTAARQKGAVQPQPRARRNATSSVV
jgi:uncharacterized Zn finger protein